MISFKKLIIINGTMGVGKSTVCRELYTQLENAVWLDGDWCWLMHPLVLSEENKQMVQDNIKYILRNYLKNSSLPYVIFSWVIHQEKIFELILRELNDLEFELYKITLVCSEVALIQRMSIGGRTEENIKGSVKRLPLYQDMNTIKIDTTDLKIPKIVSEIKAIIHGKTRETKSG